MTFFVLLCLVIVIVLFGIASISQSYATAQQAKATIETARAAQIASLGNLVTILALILLLTAVLVIGLYLYFRSKQNSQIHSRSARQTQLPGQENIPSLESMAMLLLLQLLQDQIRQRSTPLLIQPAQKEPDPGDDDFWSFN